MIFRTSRRHKLIALCALSVVALAGCATTTSGKGEVKVAGNVDLHVIGDANKAYDQTVENALSDVMTFWRQQYPKVSGGQSLPPIKGGFYSIDGLALIKTHGQAPADVAKEACFQANPGFVIDNGAYCDGDDSIIWDSSPQHELPVLQQAYGPLITAVIFAHEFGHAIQGRMNNLGGKYATVRTESQADCAAGAFLATVLQGQAAHFRATPEQLDEALLGYLQVRDTPSNDATSFSHGDGFDRYSAIANGISKGATFCYSSTYLTDVTFTERPYVTDSDYKSGGNETLAQVLNPGTDQQGGGGLQPDLNRFWEAAAKSIGKTFQPVKIAQADHPKCGADAGSEFGYCPDDNTVYYSQAYAKQAYYSFEGGPTDDTTANVRIERNEPADFALGALFVVGWGLAVRHQLFAGSMDGTTAIKAAVCYSGAYAKSINLAQTTDAHPFVLSPPDLDEASEAMLKLVGSPKAFGARGLTGLDRIQSFVQGYRGGLSVCG